MDDFEELEPLFDYRRVQPVNVISLDDDSDSSPPVMPKRRKISKSDKNNKVDTSNKDEKIAVIDCEDDEDEEDWLPPPPKISLPRSNLEEDSAIKELRLKKLELASLAKSAEDALRAVEEASKKTLADFSDKSSQQDSSEGSKFSSELSKPSSDRPKIVLSMQDKAETKQYRVYADDSFEQLFKKYAEKAKLDVQNLVFCFDGDKINPASTPQELEMEDGDLIEVHSKAK